MAKNNHIINSFVSGEVTPRFFGRTDTGQYNSALEKSENFIVYPQGGATRRPGTYFVHDCKRDDGTYPQAARVIPFYGADGTRWQLLITTDAPDKVGDQYFWKAINLEDNTVGAIHYFGAFTWLINYYNLESKAIDLNELQFAQSGDVLFIVHPDIRPMKIEYNPAWQGSLGYSFRLTSYPTVYSTNGDVTSTGTYREYPFQDKGSVYLLDSSQPASDFEIEVNVYGTLSSPPIAQLTSTGITPANFDNTWLGRAMKFSNAGKTIVVQISNIVSSTVADAVVLGGAVDSDNYAYDGDDMEFGYWDDIFGFPRAITFFEQRLVFGGNYGFPDTIWFSQVNDIAEFMQRKLEQDPDFADPITNDDTFLATLKSNVLNQIQWMLSGKTISVGTNYREFIVKGPNPQQSIGPLNIQTGSETPNGSAYVQAANIDNTVVFLQRHRAALKEFIFNLDEDSFKTSNLSILGAHMANKYTLNGEMDALAADRGGFVQMAMQQVPVPILWCIDTQGRLIGMTREKEQQVIAWHSHKIAGDGFLDLLELDDDMAFEYQPRVKSVSVIQRPSNFTGLGDGEPDELWMVVSRGVKKVEEDGWQQVLFVERMGQEWEKKTIQDGWNTEDAVAEVPLYMDCALTYNSDDHPSTVISGLDEIYGIDNIVDVVVRGRYCGQYTVNEAGEIDIANAILTDDGGEWEAIIGFNYEGLLVPVVPEVPAQLGSSMGQQRRIDQITIHFYRSIGAKFGRISDMDEEETPIDDMEEILFKEGVNENDPTPMYTGDKRLVFPQGYESRPKIKIVSHLPFPCTITHIVARQVVYE